MVKSGMSWGKVDREWERQKQILRSSADQPGFAHQRLVVHRPSPGLLPCSLFRHLRLQSRVPAPVRLQPGLVHRSPSVALFLFLATDSTTDRPSLSLLSFSSLPSRGVTQNLNHPCRQRILAKCPPRQAISTFDCRVQLRHRSGWRWG